MHSASWAGTGAASWTRACAQSQAATAKPRPRNCCVRCSRTRYRVHATAGNLNNRVGTPLTLLAAPDDAQVLVIELGTSLPGEIAKLGEIVEPDAAVVTAISEEHLEGLGDLAGVLAEETSILQALRPGGFAVVSDEPPELAQHARTMIDPASLKVAGWSERADADLHAPGCAH